MRIKERLIYINERGERLSFSTDSIFHVNIKDVSGLADIHSEIFRITSMGQDGDTLIGSRIMARDIELVGHINERDKDLARRHRRHLARVLNPQFDAKLIYEMGDFRRVINPSKNALVFVDNPILQQFTLHLECLHPFWREVNEHRQDIAMWMNGFMFPLPDGLHLPVEPTWELGWRNMELIAHVYNSGDVTAGMRIDFRALGTVVRPELINMVTGEFIRLNTTMQQGDVIVVSTGFGEKAVTLRRQGTVTDAFRFLDPDSTYMQMAVGDNVFRYNAEDNTENLEVTIHHNNFFLGV